MPAEQWKVERTTLKMRDGKVFDAAGRRSFTYADLANDAEAAKLFQQAIPSDIELASVSEWKVLGTPVLRPNAGSIVTGTHIYPSDVVRPGMLYGKILRAPAYGAKLAAVDLAAVKAMKDVTVVQDGSFIGVAAPNSFRAKAALVAISGAAKWEAAPPQPSSKDLFDHLRKNVEGGVPRNPFADEVAKGKTIRQTYRVPYIQHAPLEPRAAVAEWSEGRLTVWTGSQNPFGVRSKLVRTFHLPG